MRKIVVLFSIFVLFLTGPVTALGETSNNEVKVEGTDEKATFELDGVTYTLTLKKDGDFQEAIIDDGQSVETVSYDSQKDELRFNDEKVSEEELESMKSMISETSDVDQDDAIKIDSGSVQTFAAQKYPYKLVKSTKGSLNITTATVLAVTGLILMIPSGTGAAAGVIFGAKLIAVLASAIVASVKSSGHKYVYWKFNTYFKNQGGYWWNKRVLSVYKDKNRKKLIKTITYETKYGKKFSFDYSGNKEVLNRMQLV